MTSLLLTYPTQTEIVIKMASKEKNKSSKNAEKTLVLIKPDAMAKGLVGDVLTRLWETGLELIGTKIVQVNKALAKEHYYHMREQAFFDELIDFLQGKLHDNAPVVALVFCGKEAIKKIREATGATNPELAEPTSIRGALGRITTKGVFENVIHASSDPGEAEREIKLWFKPDELLAQVYPTQEKSVKQRVWK